MDWVQVLVIAFGNIAWMLPMFFWMRSEANAERRDIVNLIIEMKNESKDFHDRLCAIGERRNKQS